MYNFAKKITNSNGYILEKRLVVLGVVVAVACGVLFSIQTSAQTQEATFDVMREQGTNNIYMTIDLSDNQGKYKRLLPNTRILELYDNLNLPTQDTPKHTLDQYTTTTLISINRSIYSQLEVQGPSISRSDFFNITPNGEIQYLLMSRPYALDSGYNSFFYVDKEEVEGGYYTKGDSIYYTGKTDYSTNIYTYTGTLRPEENRTRIFNAIIPEGENECSIERNYIAIVRDASGYKAILPDRLQSENYENTLLSGGNVIIHIQPVLDSQTTDSSDLSFTLRCERTGPASGSINRIDVSALSGPEQSFEKTSTNEQIVIINLDPGYHTCSFLGNGVYGLYGEHADIIDGDPLAGGTYTVLVDLYEQEKSNIQWTIKCTKVQIIPLQPNVINQINSTTPGVFQLGVPPTAQSLECLNRNKQILLLQQISSSGQRTTDVLFPDIEFIKSIAGNTFFLNARHFSASNIWNAACSTTNNTSRQQIDPTSTNTSTTTLLTGTPVAASPTNNNPNLLRNVVARADQIAEAKGLPQGVCANHLLDLDKSTSENGIELGDILLVPADLCIEYIVTNHDGGQYIDDERRAQVYYWGDGTAYERLNAQYTLIHELCHAQQDYYSIGAHIDLWAHLSPQFTSNISGGNRGPLAGYRQLIRIDHTKLWYYPNDGEYNGMYGTPGWGWRPPFPVDELGAEFCTLFATSDRGRRDIVDIEYGPNGHNPTLTNGKPATDTVLGDTIAKRWVNQYMVNPNLEPLIAPILPSNIQITNVQTQNNQLSFDISWDVPSQQAQQALEDKNLPLQYEFGVLENPSGYSFGSFEHHIFRFDPNNSPSTITIPLREGIGRYLPPDSILELYIYPPRIESRVEVRYEIDGLRRETIDFTGTIHDSFIDITDLLP